LPDLVPVFEAYRHAPMVSISNDQRSPVPWLNWVGTVHHGLPTEIFRFTERPDATYLAFVGRITPEKGVEDAIEIAYRAGVPIRIAAKIEPRPHSLALDRAYIDEIREHFGSPLVQYVGELGDAEKQDLLGNALALVFPIKWEEPFGLAMIEAMATGTPVIAYRRGSVPEVVSDGETGFVVTDSEEAADAAHRATRLDRRHIRRVFEKRFSAERMARDYLAIYERLIESRQAQPRLAAVSVADGATTPIVTGDPQARDPLAGAEIGP
jgi:glycosyltransferase involved in cell wall biosynthesis